MSGVIRVVVADDHGVVREGIRHVLSGEAGFEIVGEAANSADAMVLVESLRPDVAVLDISMPGESVHGMLPFSTYSLSAQLALRSRNQDSVW